MIVKYRILELSLRSLCTMKQEILTLRHVLNNKDVFGGGGGGGGGTSTVLITKAPSTSLSVSSMCVAPLFHPEIFVCFLYLSR